MDRAELLEELRAARDRVGGSRAMAEQLGVKEGTLKAILSANFNNTTTIDKVLEPFVRLFLHGVLCPHVEKRIEHKDCLARSSSPRPFGGAAKLAWWTTCQTCPHKGGRDEI